jgi:hypothetical protein
MAKPYDVDASHQPLGRYRAAMIAPEGATLLATVCNAIPSAAPYALWLVQGETEYLVDLSDVLGQEGDCGLTGLASDGERLYAAVQSGISARILILDRSLTPVGVISSPEFADIHSIHMDGDSLIVCSTGSRSVLRVNLADHSVMKLGGFDGPVHLNSACFDDATLLVCCHHLKETIPDAIGGGVIDPNGRRVALAGLGQPHSLVKEDDGFLILDSDAHRVVRFDRTGITHQALLAGFLRGLAACDGSLFVARSAGRVISRKNPAANAARAFWDMAVERVCIYELDAATLNVKAEHFPLVAGFEIYDLLVLDGAQAVDPARKRLVVPDIHAMARAYYEAAKRAYAEIHERAMAQRSG